ncbi:MAG: GntR family transcriptional regulator [Armatimonadota bacterium]
MNPAAALTFDSLLVRSLHHQVQAFILKSTHEGTLGPGDRLNESAISAQLGISRTPVREALTYLESSGLVVRRPRRGFYLAALDAADAHHHYAVRELLEGYAARQVAGRLSDAQVETLQEIIVAMGRAAGVGDWPQVAVHNIAFHETVVGVAGNPVLSRLWTSVGPVLWYFDSLTRKTPGPTEKEGFVQRHEVLLAALRDGNPDTAASAFVSHIQAVQSAVITRLRDHESIQRGKYDE